MKKLLNNSTTQSGFTLVELLVAIMVGAVLVSGVNEIYVQQVYLSQQVRDVVVVNSYAEGKIEALRSAGYLGVATGTTNLTSELPSGLSPPRSGSQIVSTHSTSVKQIELDITYNEQGKSQTYTYITYIGELGVGQ